MPAFFDSLIAIGIAITALPALILLYNKIKRKESWEHNHPKTTNLISLVLLFGATILIWGSFLEPKLLVTTYAEIDLPKIEKEIKIALIGDIHVGPYVGPKDILAMNKRIVELNPDLIFFAGDHIMSEPDIGSALSYINEVQTLANKIPIYAVNGNHEYGIGSDHDVVAKRYRLPDRHKEVENKFDDISVTYLTNETKLVEVNEQSFILFGSDEFLANKIDYSSLENVKKENNSAPVLMLVHNPAAIYEAVEKKVDLVLAGHTHGGQIRLPFFGAIGKIETDIPKGWYQGLNKYKDTLLYVTSGIGESSVRARLFNPPEVVLLTIK